MRRPQRVGVVFDTGAASLTEVANAGDDDLVPVVLVAPGDQASATHQLLTRLAVENHPLQRAFETPGDLALDGLTTFSERRLESVGDLLTRLGLRGHTPEVVRAVTDKAHQRELLGAAGLAQPRSASVTDLTALRAAVAGVGLPAVIKPSRGEGSSHVHAVSSLPEAERAALAIWDEDQGRPLQVESYLVGVGATVLDDYVSVETTSRDGQHSLIAVTGKFPMAPPFRERGHVWPCQLGDRMQGRVTALTSQCLDALGVRDGISHTEVKITPDGPVVIEVNGRLGGYIAPLVRQVAGTDLVREGLLAATGRGSAAAVEGEGVTFQRHSLAPLDAVRLIQASGHREARRLPGVSSCVTLVPRNSPLRKDGSTELLDMLCGSAPTHEAADDVVTQAHSLMTQTFGRADGLTECLSVAAWDKALGHRREPTGRTSHDGL